MILGRGTAASDEALITEFHQLLATTGHVRDTKNLREIRNAPLHMRDRIGKPILRWSEEDVLALYQPRPSVSAIGHYNRFLAFLLFRGYFQAHVPFLFALPIQLTSQFKPALAAHRAKLSTVNDLMGYRNESARKLNNDGVGGPMELYIWCLIVVHKTAEELTREDFDSFKAAYQAVWSQGERKRKDGAPRLNHALYRLEQVLVQIGIIAEKKRSIEHESYFTEFPPSSLRESILSYLNWGKVKYSTKSQYARRMALHRFLHWLSDQYPHCIKLDDVSRSIALAYAAFLKQLQDEHEYSTSHVHYLYHQVLHCFDYVIEERLETAPPRNPFSRSDLPKKPAMLPRYLPDQELQIILNYCEHDATLFEKTLTITLLHTGIRAGELAVLKASDIVQIGGVWKLHIHEGKGLKDRVIPLTEQCVQMLLEWKKSGWQQTNDFLFTSHGRPWTDGLPVSKTIRVMTQKLGLTGVTPHRFRHTFAVALLNYGVRESAIQKLMGHATLGMTLEYARILDETVERSFTEAVSQMQEGPISWVPSFFAQEDYTLFAEGDSISWIRLPMGYCRRNAKLHCESDVKCLLCDRFAIGKEDLPRLQQMQERFIKLGLKMKADVVTAQIQRLELPSGNRSSTFIPAHSITVTRTSR